MKVAVDGIIFERQLQGGISRLYREILPRICAADNSVQVTLLTSRPVQQKLPWHARLEHQLLLPIDTWLRPGRFFWRQQSGLRALIQSWWLKRNRPDIWHSSYYTLATRWPGPVVCTVYDLIYERYPMFYSNAQAEWIKKHKMESVLRADTIICISETTKQDVIRFYGVNPDKLYVIPLAPSDVFIKFNAKDNHSETQRPFILFVGRRNNYKNFITLLLAFSRWPERRNVDLVVVGESWSETECRILEKAGFERHVQLITNIDDHQLAILYNRAMVFVYPSLYEGFGLPLLEAMACGCPVIASRIPTNFEVAGDYAIYFEPEDGDTLISALEQAISDGRSAWRVQQGLQHVKEYTWDNTAQQTLSVYRKLAR